MLGTLGDVLKVVVEQSLLLFADFIPSLGIGSESHGMFSKVSIGRHHIPREL